MKKLPSQDSKAGKAKRGRPADPNARERILEGAAIAFMERGYSGTSIDDVAKAIGATKGFIYPHFGGKADLYFSIQEASIEKISSTVRAEFARGLEPADKLHRMALAHMRTILSDFPSAKVGVQGLERSVMLSASEKERARLRRNIELRDAYEAMYVVVIEEGIDAGVFVRGRPRILVKGFMGALNWVTIWFNPDRPMSRETSDEICHALADFALRGLSP